MSRDAVVAPLVLSMALYLFIQQNSSCYTVVSMFKRSVSQVVLRRTGLLSA